MADDFITNAGSGGDTFAADEIAAVKYPRVKLVLGADGAADNDVDSGAQLSAASVPVVLASDHADVSIDDGGNAITVDWSGTAPPIGAGTEATALRVTLATDSTGLVSVDDNGGSLTIDGTVTANLSAVDNAVLDTINTAVEATQAAVEGTLTVGSHAVTNAGTFATQATLQANSGVDVGDVDVTSVVPGTAATNLGKAIDSVAGATDTGVGMLAVIATDATGVIAGAAGDWAPPNMDSKGRLRVSPGGQHAFDTFIATTGWTVFNDDTANIATTLDHVTLTGALSFDKVDGAGNSVLAGIQKTVSSVSLNNIATGALFFQTLMNIPDATNVQNVVIRLGTDNTNYNEWKIAATSADITAGVWEVYRVLMGNSTGSTGNGWNLTAVTWIFVGVEFATAADTLAAILVDSLTATGGQINSSDTSSEISTSVSSPNINLQKIGGSVVDRGAGNVSNGSQRVVLATDDINTAAMKVALEIIDNAISGSEMQVDVVADLPAGANLVGDVGISGARTSGGTTPLKNLDVDEGAGDVIKNSAGQLYWVHAMNTGAVPNYLKFYNVAGASVTVGTTVPVLTFLVPANADSDGAGFVLSVPNGIAFGTAMSMAATLNAADNDATAPTGTIIVNLGYA